MIERVYMLPGLGADAALFEPQRHVEPRAVVPDWITPRAGESLGGYAERFAATIERDRPWAVVGFSFGGMVALEMARRLPEAERPVVVGLVSGLRSRRAVSNAFRAQVAVGTRVPGGLAKPVIAGPLARLFARRNRLDARRSANLRAMADRADWAFLRWAARACAAWDFDGRCPVPVRGIHGERDDVIPYVPHPELGDNTRVLPGAGHLITWTEAEAVNAWMAEILEASDRGASGPGAGE